MQDISESRVKQQKNKKKTTTTNKQTCQSEFTGVYIYIIHINFYI